jgi:NitT/TauT family transport system substrate-binding protein
MKPSFVMLILKGISGLLAFFLVPFWVSAAETSLEKVRLGYPARSLAALHIRIAQEKGFYRKYGLDVEAIQLRPTVNAVALVSGEVQYTSSLGSAVRSAAMGSPLKIASVSLMAPIFSLVSRPRYATLQDLKGKDIGINGNPGSTNDRVIRLILRRVGIDPQKDLQLLYSGDAVVLYSAFKAGRFDAMFIALPFPVIAEQEGYRILHNAAETVRLPLAGLAVHEERVRVAPDQIKRMIKADVEARRFIKTEKDATVQVISRWLGLERTIAARSYDLFLPAVSQEPMIDYDGIRRTLELEGESGVTLKITEAEKIINSKMVEEAKRELPESSR